MSFSKTQKLSLWNAIFKKNAASISQSLWDGRSLTAMGGQWANTGHLIPLTSLLPAISATLPVGYPSALPSFIAEEPSSISLIIVLIACFISSHIVFFLTAQRSQRKDSQILKYGWPEGLHFHIVGRPFSVKACSQTQSFSCLALK